jgi:hypothetical protein
MDRVVVKGNKTTITISNAHKTTSYAPSEKTRDKGACARAASAAPMSREQVALRRAKLAENARWHRLCPRGAGKAPEVEAFVKKYIEIKEAVRQRGPRGGPRHPFTPLEDFFLVNGIIEGGPASYDETQVRRGWSIALPSLVRTPLTSTFCSLLQLLYWDICFEPQAALKEVPALSAVDDGQETSHAETASTAPSYTSAAPPDSTPYHAAIAAAAVASLGVHGFSAFKRTVVDLKSRWETLVKRYRGGWEMPDHLRIFVESGALERAVDAFERRERLRGQLGSRTRRDLDLEAEGREAEAGEDRDEPQDCHTRPPPKVHIREQAPAGPGEEGAPQHNALTSVLPASVAHGVRVPYRPECANATYDTRPDAARRASAPACASSEGV